MDDGIRDTFAIWRYFGFKITDEKQQERGKEISSKRWNHRQTYSIIYSRTTNCLVPAAYEICHETMLISVI